MKKTKSMNQGRKVAIIISYIFVFVVGYTLAYQLKPVPEQSQPLAQLPTYQNYSASTNVLAVKGDGSSGVMGKVIIEIQSGNGRVLMNTNPFLEPDTQYSAETAVSVAQNITGKSLKDRDVIVSFDMTGQVLGGPSAGAAMTVATIAAIEEKQVRKDVAITGTIEQSGNIGRIGGVLEKAEAAGENGIKLFLVPEGEGILTYYEQQLTTKKVSPGFVIRKINYVPKTLDLNNYTMTQWGMKTEEVSTINDAVADMLG